MIKQYLNNNKMSSNFNIFVKLANSKTLSLEINKSMTIQEVKKKIMSLVSQQSNQFDDVFISVGTKMIGENNESLTVQDMNISRDSTIFVLPRLRGG